jgi:hypothetical protein
MTSCALQPVTRQSDPDAVVVNLRLSLRELTLLYALAHAFGTWVISSTVAACEGDAATVLHRATCRLYVALRETTGRGGL